jgi:hypothetical protein
MASLSETRRLRAQAQQPEVDVRQIIAEAQNRWLRPVEVCEILKNYNRYGFKLNPVPPVRPCSGSMFLFDRKTLRYFRKDGHNWRKKKDGKTVREAHERLKTGSVDVLHCYYAHGEDNPSFQRRCYWMLDTALEHIVLVHYREVTEASRFAMTDSHNSAAPASSVHAATSPIEVSNPTGSPELLEHDDDVADSEEPEDNATSLDSGASTSSAAGPQHTLLDQISPRPQGSNTDSRSSSPGNHNSWSGLDPRGGGSAFSNSWTSGSGGGNSSSLLGIERLLESPTGLTPRPGSGTYYPSAQTSMNNGQDMSSSMPNIINNQSSSQGGKLYPAGSSQGIITASLEPSNYGNMVGGESYLAGGQGRQNSSSAGGAPEISPWNQLLENSRNTPSFSQGGVNMGGGFGNQQSSGGPGSNFVSGSVAPVYVKQESMNGTTWADMLEQCTTPSTHRNIMETLMSNSRSEGGPEPPTSTTQDLFTTQMPSPKGILDALSPRGLGREPQTPLEASLRAVTQEHVIKSAAETFQRRFPHMRSDSQPLSPLWDNKNASEVEYSKLENIESFSKLDSFNRWVGNLSGDGNQSYLTPGPVSYGWPSTPTMEDQGLGEDLYNISQMQVDTGLSTSVSSDQRFSITDFSPDWAYATEGAKVLVTGTFLGKFTNAINFKWCCMFGEVEVPADVVGPGVLRCSAPPHAAGRLPFYVTCGDRQGHSELREFEYRAGGRVCTDKTAEHQAEQERLLKVRLARMLLTESQSNSAVCSTDSDADSIFLKQQNCANAFATSYTDEEWEQLNRLARTSGDEQDVNFQDRLLQMLFKNRMQKWLLCKIQEEGKGASILDEEGQGVLHMAAALGYDWVIAPMLAAGVPINFRDWHGWTALHWAAFHGREETVIALTGAGADAGTVTDPTPSCPSGQTPAELASMHGHVGIAGFLAENSLTRRLSVMSIKENPLDLAMSHMAGDNAVATLYRRESIKRSVNIAEDQVSIRDSLQAVRNAARAAALIQAAFRQHSFRKQEEDNKLEQIDEYGMTPTQLRSLMARKLQRGHNEKKQHLAATRIQQKFRGWKVRKDFLNFRQRVVKLQAQVRGNLVRKRFKKLLWSVGILEKAVLRWRRKGSGLRGFKSMELPIPGKDDDEEFLKEGRKQTEVALEKAVTTVQSMVRSRQARAQYQRLREGSLKAEQLKELSLPASPQDFTSTTDIQFQTYQQVQISHRFLDGPTDQSMFFTD